MPRQTDSWSKQGSTMVESFRAIAVNLTIPERRFHFLLPFHPDGTEFITG